MKKRKQAIAIGDLIAPALRDLGMPSARLTQRVRAAWERVADPTWRADVVPLRLEGGVLVIGVASAALRQDLALFHKDRLLTVLRTALPDLTLIGLRFTAETRSTAPAEDATGDRA